MEPAALKRWVVLAVAVLVVGAAAFVLRDRILRPTSADDDRPRPIVPAGTRIRLEVINATRSRGLARRATFYLRDLGFDVVRFATDTTSRDTTLIIDRDTPPHPDWTRLVVKALGTGRVQSAPDSSRYLDVTVVLGADWRPPAKPFYP